MGTNQEIKVCHLISGDLWAGAEVQAFLTIKALANMPQLEIMAIVLNEGKLASQLRQAGVETYVIEESKSAFTTILRHIIILLKDKGFDIVHSHRYKENILAALVKKKCGVKRLVQTVHGLQEDLKGFRSIKSHLYMRLDRYFARRFFDKIIVVSSDIRSRLRRFYNPDRIEIIYNAVDISQLRPTKDKTALRNEFDIKTNEFVIGTAGRMVPVKGYDVLLKAVGILSRSKTNVRFILAGEGPLKEKLERQVADYGVKDRVTFVGFRDDMPDFLNCLDLFIMSSHHEGIPMVLLEAMALRKPIVATAVGGITEVVESDMSALLVDPGNPRSLADACGRLIDDPDLARRLAHEAEKRIQKSFSLDIHKEKLFRLYTGMLNK
jgi:glycosyltransferase involved in cell wall biosynthesis